MLTHVVQAFLSLSTLAYLFYALYTCLQDHIEKRNTIRHNDAWMYADTVVLSRKMFGEYKSTSPDDVMLDRELLQASYLKSL